MLFKVKSVEERVQRSHQAGKETGVGGRGGEPEKDMVKVLD